MFCASIMMSQVNIILTCAFSIMLDALYFTMDSCLYIVWTYRFLWQTDVLNGVFCTGLLTSAINSNSMEVEMEMVLNKVGLEACLPSFVHEKISPDLVCKLSMTEMNMLGVHNSSDMMKLRNECIKYGPMLNQTGSHGPKYNISKEVLESLLQSGFKVHEVAKLLSVSERTVYRRMAKYNLAVYEFSDIDDASLETEVGRVTTEFPRIGESMIRVVLQQRGIKVTRSRLRDCLHSIDSIGISERLRRRLHRRVYNVTAPNHLWHIDTNHKLIRWRFIICGGIDGFSRFITFLSCEANNQAETIFKCFNEAIRKYGIPLRVRSDQGRENIKVADYMLKTRGLNRRSMITGKSTHNQRIERLWRDVYDGVLCFYYDLFHFMEDNEILDPLNEIHIYALHHVYKNKINEKLSTWKQAWANHRLRTARSSPLRLFLCGSLNCPVEVPETEELYGVEGEISLEDDATPQFDGRPMLEPLRLQFGEGCEEELQIRCPTDWISENYGIDVFQDAVSVILRFHQIQ